MTKHSHRNHDRRWHVELVLDGGPEEREATAQVYVGDAIYEAHGQAPNNAVAPAIGEELAVARALSEISHQLVRDAVRQADAVAHSVDEVVDDAFIADVEVPSWS